MIIGGNLISPENWSRSYLIDIDLNFHNEFVNKYDFSPSYWTSTHPSHCWKRLDVNNIKTASTESGVFWKGTNLWRIVPTPLTLIAISTSYTDPYLAYFIVTVMSRIRNFRYHFVVQRIQNFNLQVFITTIARVVRKNSKKICHFLFFPFFLRVVLSFCWICCVVEGGVGWSCFSASKSFLWSNLVCHININLDTFYLEMKYSYFVNGFQYTRNTTKTYARKQTCMPLLESNISN